jgi:hypothetical protein
MKSPIRPRILVLLLAAAAVPFPSFAADTGPATPRDPVLEGASAATARQDWPAARTNTSARPT